MRNLKRLVVAAVLTFMLGLCAFAGEVNTPPCDPNPGEMSAPPCSATQFASDDPVAPGQTDTPPASMLADASAFAISLFESLMTF